MQWQLAIPLPEERKIRLCQNCSTISVSSHITIRQCSVPWSYNHTTAGQDGDVDQTEEPPNKYSSPNRPPRGTFPQLYRRQKGVRSRSNTLFNIPRNYNFDGDTVDILEVLFNASNSAIFNGRAPMTYSVKNTQFYISPSKTSCKRPGKS